MLLISLISIPLIALATDDSTELIDVASAEKVLSKNEKTQLLLQLSTELDVNLVVEDYIRLQASLANVDVCVALDIAFSESEFNPSAKNKTSTASGVYQFLDSTWNNYATKYWGANHGKNKLNYRDNVDLAIMVLKNVGTRDWDASKYTGKAWSKQLYSKGNC